jgi:hypothetical protein
MPPERTWPCQTGTADRRQWLSSKLHIDPIAVEWCSQDIRGRQPKHRDHLPRRTVTQTWRRRCMSSAIRNAQHRKSQRCLPHLVWSRGLHQLRTPRRSVRGRGLGRNRAASHRAASSVPPERGLRSGVRHRDDRSAPLWSCPTSHSVTRCCGRPARYLGRVELSRQEAPPSVRSGRASN